jgi:transposase InsO family protein
MAGGGPESASTQRVHARAYATRPDEYWHVDVTVIKLLDGTKVYLHGVIDNLTRRILAWKVVPEYRSS